MSGTPRTDKATLGNFYPTPTQNMCVVPSVFAAQLETELYEVLAANKDLNNALMKESAACDDAMTRLRIEKELRVRTQEERDVALARIEDLGDEIRSLYATSR